MTHRASERPRIGLVVDHPLRDAHGMALVAHLLAQRGVSTVLIPFYALSFDLPSLNLDLLLLNYTRRANLRLIRDAQRRGVELAVLDTEGGLLAKDGPTSPDGMAEFLRSSGLDRDLALYMFWGSDLRDHLVANTALEPERAVVTGCPRFDLAHDPWTERRAERGFVLVNTNFPAVNSAHAAASGIDRKAMADAGFSEAGIEEFIGFNRKVMDAFTEAVAAIAAARPAMHFVLRPHPFESDVFYRQRFADTPNLEIRREGTVLDVLAEASCLLHVNCTTSIEAVMCGIPAISLDYANHPGMLRLLPLPAAISHRAKDHAAALELIDKGCALPVASDDVARQIVPFFGPIDGRASERVATQLAQFANGASGRQGSRPRPDGDILQGLLALAGRTIGSRAIEGWRQRRRPSRRDKALAWAELRATLDRFAAAQAVPPARLERLANGFGAPMLSYAVRPPDRTGQT